MARLRTCLIGTGSIAEVHAEALKALGVAEISVVVDPIENRRVAFARKWGAARAVASVDEALAADDVDVAHVLTPPNTHVAVTEMVLRARRHVLIEKPVSETHDEARRLSELARESSVVAAVNQNFIHHPAFAKLLEAVRCNQLGPLRHVIVAYDVPLRQLAARQFGHWMFNQPRNILLEQAVHPLSQMLALDADLELITATMPGGSEISPGITFIPTAEATFRSPRISAVLQFAVGRAFSNWHVTAVCDDGVAVADVLANRFHVWSRTRAMEPVDALMSGLGTASQIARSSIGNALNYALSLAKFKGRSDPFFLSMRDGIAAFYDAVGRKTTAASPGVTDVEHGGRLVGLCEQIVAKSSVSTPSPRAPRPATQEPCDVAVIGGTGFIGAATVRKLISVYGRVRVMARNVNNLDAIFYDAKVSVMRGDVTNSEDVGRVVAGARFVVNLAHGGGSGSWPAIEKALVGSARLVGDACHAAGVTRLVHVGSIAGLYAGDPGDVITGATPPDPRSIERGDYSRAKADADRMLMDRVRASALPVCILRPGVVVGDGTSPFHSGLGTFNNDQHCLGWNDGNNPLPFVLVDDVADAIVKALTSPQALGKSYNLVGDVRPSARAFVERLAKETRRPLKFHPSSVFVLYGEEIMKWLVKRAVGRKAPFPGLRDLRSRGLAATFDCSDAKRDLQWSPESDLDSFFARAFGRL